MAKSLSVQWKSQRDSLARVRNQPQRSFTPVTNQPAEANLNMLGSAATEMTPAHRK